MAVRFLVCDAEGTDASGQESSRGGRGGGSAGRSRWTLDPRGPVRPLKPPHRARARGRCPPTRAAGDRTSVRDLARSDRPAALQQPGGLPLSSPIQSACICRRSGAGVALFSTTPQESRRGARGWCRSRGGRPRRRMPRPPGRPVRSPCSPLHAAWVPCGHACAHERLRPRARSKPAGRPSGPRSGPSGPRIPATPTSTPPSRSTTSSTCSPTPPGRACTSGTRWATSRRTSSRDASGWRATTCCTHGLRRVRSAGRAVRDHHRAGIRRRPRGRTSRPSAASCSRSG